MNKSKDGSKGINWKMLVGTNIVPILFIVLSAVAIPIAGYSGTYIVREIVTRLGRNTFLVLALLIPVMAGMGINFGLALGAYAGQISMILITDWKIGGPAGMFLAMLISTPISILLGGFAGFLLNRAKGREMITSYILGFFMLGIYQAVVLFAMGPVIPISDPSLFISRGFGIRSSIELGGVRGSFDRLLDNILGVSIQIAGIQIPVFSLLLIAVLCLLIIWFRKTKFGQEIRAVGQDMGVSATAGINVDRTRIISMIISTVLAGYGQLIYLQNIGTMSVYSGADTVALFAAAALLVGGATVNKAGIPSVILGTALFHMLFIVMPAASNRAFGSAVMSEYFRSIISYSAVTLALILNAWNRHKDKERARFGNRANN
ncbi:MAG: ABC transporter permease [Clostridiales bacterium]|nr:ABC transporter permease [Clostridiales bacterium]